METQQEAHAKEHELVDRIWTAKLDAIDSRLRSIERVLLEVRLPNGHAPAGRLRVTRRDVGVVSGSAAATSLAWWLGALVQRVAGN